MDKNRTHNDISLLTGLTTNFVNFVLIRIYITITGEDQEIKSKIRFGGKKSIILREL